MRQASIRGGEGQGQGRTLSSPGDIMTGDRGKVMGRGWESQGLKGKAEPLPLVPFQSMMHSDFPKNISAFC